MTKVAIQNNYHRFRHSHRLGLLDVQTTEKKLVNGSRNTLHSNGWSVGQIVKAYAVAVIAKISLGKVLLEDRNHEELALCMLGTYSVIVVVVRHDC
jgi:hypothetical protein